MFSIEPFIYLVKSVKNEFLFAMTADPGQTRTTLDQSCAALWDNQSRLDVMQPEILIICTTQLFNIQQMPS
jgi:hypothetical protein